MRKMKKICAVLLVSSLFWGLWPVILHTAEFPGQFNLHDTLVSSFLVITGERLPQNFEHTNRIFAHHLARATNIARTNFGCKNPVFTTEVKLNREGSYDYLRLTLTSRLLTCN